MEKRPLVVLLGDSVLIDGVAASLKGKGALSVIYLDLPSVDVQDRLVVLKPHLVVFELDSPYASSAFTFLREHPGITLVGLDLTCSRAIVLNSEQHIAPTLDSLCQIVQTKASGKLVYQKEGDGTDTVGAQLVDANETELFTTFSRARRLTR